MSNVIVTYKNIHTGKVGKPISEDRYLALPVYIRSRLTIIERKTVAPLKQRENQEEIAKKSKPKKSENLKVEFIPPEALESDNKE